MGKELLLVTPLHLQTNRDCLARMVDEKVHCMKIARQYEADYWDGDRRYGYGGYKYDGRWIPVARDIIDYFSLNHFNSWNNFFFFNYLYKFFRKQCDRKDSKCSGY